MQGHTVDSYNYFNGPLVFIYGGFSCSSLDLDGLLAGHLFV